MRGKIDKNLQNTFGAIAQHLGALVGRRPPSQGEEGLGDGYDHADHDEA